MTIVTHLKSGRRYLVVCSTVVNGTNAQDGDIMTMYIGRYKNKKGIGVFVRNTSEFNVKFRKTNK